MSFWQNFLHRLHQKMSTWPLPVQPLTKILSHVPDLPFSRVKISLFQLKNPKLLLYFYVSRVRVAHAPCMWVRRLDSGHLHHGWLASSWGRGPWPGHAGPHRRPWRLPGQCSTDQGETWWGHGMRSFSALLALCEGNPPVTGGFPSQRSSCGPLIFLSM